MEIWFLLVWLCIREGQTGKEEGRKKGRRVGAGDVSLDLEAERRAQQ